MSGSDFLLIAEESEGEIAGYIWAERGKLNRILHTAYIVIGIREAYRHQGIGTEFFNRLDEWARKNSIVRLELTVECANTTATASESCGQYVNAYWMENPGIYGGQYGYN